MNVIELKAAMDTGFTEAKADIAELKADIVEIRADIVEIRADIVEIKADIVEIKADIVEIKADLVTVNERITAEAVTTRRHFDVVAEHLRSDIALLAGAVTTISSTLERSIAENRSEHATFMSLFQNHEVRLIALERQQ